MLYSRNSCISLWCTKTPLVIKNLKWADFVLSSDLNQKFSNYMQDLKILVTQKTADKWNTTVVGIFTFLVMEIRDWAHNARSEFKITSLQLHFFLTLKWSGRFFWISLYFTSLWKLKKKFHFTLLRFLKKWFFLTSLYFTSNFVSLEVTSLHFTLLKI